MLVASFMLYAELESAGNMADNLQMLGASMDKANSIDDTPVMDIDGAELRPEDASVRFEDVSFSYGERTILDHVSLTRRQHHRRGRSLRRRQDHSVQSHCPLLGCSGRKDHRRRP